MTPPAVEGWEPLFWLVFERSANPMVLLDDQRRILEANPPALEVLGYTRGDLIGRSLTEILAPEERRRAAEDWQRFARTGDYSGNGALVRSDGAVIDVEFAARMVSFGDRRLAVYVALSLPTPETQDEDATVDELLTPREREVVTLIALGETTASIARQLHVSPETVKTHVRNAMAKLGVHTRAQLVAVCLAQHVPVRLPQLG